MRRTKIIATIGPASENPIVLQKIIKAGMNVARLNFSHGTHAWHAKTIRTIRRLAKKQGETVAILGDLQGPKIRLGVLPEKGIELKNGETVTLPVTYRTLYKDLKKGDRVYIDDGILEVIFVKGVPGTITVKVTNGGLVTSHKGMNFPDSTLTISSLTAKDKEDIIFGVQQGVDWLALSFVTSPADVHLLRRLIKKASQSLNHPITQSLPKIIVKIEKHEALDRFDQILAVTDAVMVARGDLGVETEAADVPIRQKEMITKCREAGKAVVVATQMLDSMIRNPRPTRAEVSDVANAVCDHTDAVMLSGESAGGKYPVQAVSMMARIVSETEASPFENLEPASLRAGRFRPTLSDGLPDLSRALAMLATDGQIDAIVASLVFAPFAESLMSARPELTMYLACSTDGETRQQNIRWGVRPFTLIVKDPEKFTEKSIAELKKRRWIKKGMKLAIVAGGEHGTGFDMITV